MQNLRFSGAGVILDGVISVSAAAFPSGEMRPKDQTFKFWTADPGNMPGGQVLVSGTVYLSRVNTPGPAQACSEVDVAVTTAGGTLTSGQNLLGVFNPSGTQLALSGDQTTPWGSTGLKPVTGLSFATLADSFLWVALISVGTTPASFLRGAAAAGVLNANLTTANYRAATNVAGQTALPSPLVPASNVSAGLHIWCAIR